MYLPVNPWAGRGGIVPQRQWTVALDCQRSPAPQTHQFRVDFLLLLVDGRNGTFVVERSPTGASSKVFVGHQRGPAPVAVASRTRHERTRLFVAIADSVQRNVGEKMTRGPFSLASVTRRFRHSLSRHICPFICPVMAEEHHFVMLLLVSHQKSMDMGINTIKA